MTRNDPPDIDEPPAGSAARPRRARPARLDEVGEDYVVVRAPRNGLPKVVVVLLVFAVVLVAGAVGARAWYQRQVDPPGPPGDVVSVEVPQGTSVNGLGSLLDAEGVISSSTVFRFWVRDREVEVQAGRYEFRKGSSFEEALAVVEGGPAPPELTRVTIPEGLILSQMVDKLAADLPRWTPESIREAFLGGTRSPLQPPEVQTLEGLLFPSTYELGEDDEPTKLVERMIQQTTVVLDQEGIAAGVQGTDVPQLTPYQVLIVASLIQAEAGNPDEGPQIARVIYNRLDRGQTLGIDATSQYEAKLNGGEPDFETDSPYNTRTRTGLPPTPIGAPGQAAIRAALHPAEGDWRYYVLSAPGVHAFTADYDEFLRLKDECEQKGLGCG